MLLLLAIIGGSVFPGPLAIVSSLKPWRYGIVFGVMLLTALPLAISDFKSIAAKPVGFLLANLVNLLVVPMLCLGGQLVLDAPTAAGLIAVGATPCTLASAAVWTRRAGGNDALALMVTLSTNLACFLSAPLVIGLLAGAVADLPTGPLVLRLALLVLLPVLLAQLLRIAPAVRNSVQTYKTKLGIMAQLGLLAIVLMSAQSMGARLSLGQLELTWRSGLTIVAACSLVHVGALGCGKFLAARCGLSRADQIAVAISGSQKTLMVGVVICDDLGFSILPIVVYHGTQLLIDTVLADRWSRHAAENQPAAETDDKLGAMR